ncbi:probable disease resistance protein RPP1 [Raphanus sativus]|uniref:Probable disease resistance protein RPP1 n=1 Tax=Raphanus sativus TaxID=3726 RepID=A0A9W3CB38_RAPSA|nr:probable disease resistance protein RPP1 [Raphanus sativus]
MVELPSSIGKLVNIDLECIGELDLSDCSWWEIYRESSTDIQEFDPWIESISGLGQLVLNGMKKLVSLPPLPDSLWLLDAKNCESLERLDCSFRNQRFRNLHFTNCFKLNQEARDLISLTRTNDYAVFPAEEVPQCFTYRSSGSSVTVNITSGGNALTAGYKRLQGVYPGHLYTFEVEVETEEVTSAELVFDFELQYNILSERSEAWEIKECGMVQLLEVSSC